jgi:MFS family permease
VIQLTAFPPLVQILLAGTLLTRTAFFMVWPFLAVILLRDFHLSPSQIGSILAGASAAGNLMGFYFGNLSDRFGRRNIMIAGCVGSVVAFVALASAQSVLLYSLGAVLVGLCRSAIETPASALISEAIEEPATRELAFHARYFLANVGGAVGPLMGFMLGIAAQQTTFLLTALTYLVFAGTLVMGFRRAPEVVSPYAKEEAHISKVIRTLRRDHSFLMLIIASFLAYAAYAQVESTLVQYLNLTGSKEGVGLVTALIATNGLTIIVFQFPLLRLLRAYDLYVRIYAGLTLFVAGFVIYVFLPLDTYPGWVLGTWVLSMGEAILFPTLNLQADRMASGRLRGSYFGALTLSNLGFAGGPLIGGVMLQMVGGPKTFSLTVLIIILGGLSYWQSSRMAVPAKA